MRIGSLDVDSSIIVLLDIWHSALKEVLDVASHVTIPFWRNDSEHAAIECRLTEFEISESNGLAARTHSLILTRNLPTPLYRGGISSSCSE